MNTDPGRLFWAHQDTSGNLQALADQARARARAGDWADDAESERLARAWILDVLAATAALGPAPISEVVDGDPTLAPLADLVANGRRYFINLRQSSRADNLDWQTSIAFAVAALASGRGMRSQADLTPTPGTVRRIVTRDADPPVVVGDTTGTTDAAILPGIIGAVVVVSCVGLVAGAVGWITSQYFEAKAIGLTADAKAKQTATAIQAAVDVVERHQAAELAQQKTLQYDTGELVVLDTLRSSIKDLSGWQPPALRSAPNLGAATSAIGAGMGIGTAIALAVAAWLFFGGNKKAA
jgi:hypothetical protein